MKYIDGKEINIGDIFTDGDNSREDIRLKNRAKVLYVDKFTLVWFPLNDFTTHTESEKYKYTSQTWCLSKKPKKISIEDLTKEELYKYNNTSIYLNEQEL